MLRSKLKKFVLRFVHLMSCENWVSQILKFLIHVDSSRRYNRIEVLHAYVMIQIKEVCFEVCSSPLNI